MEPRSSHAGISLLDWPCLRNPAQHACAIEIWEDCRMGTASQCSSSTVQQSCCGTLREQIVIRTHLLLILRCRCIWLSSWNACGATAPFTWILSQSGLPVAASRLPRVFGRGLAPTNYFGRSPPRVVLLWDFSKAWESAYLVSLSWQLNPALTRSDSVYFTVE